MTYFTITVGGKAIAATKTNDDLDVELLIEDEAFRADLVVLETDGKSIWNGEDKIAFRRSTDKERDHFEATAVQARADGDYDENDFIAYLVDVEDPTDDEMDDQPAH